MDLSSMMPMLGLNQNLLQNIMPMLSQNGGGKPQDGNSMQNMMQMLMPMMNGGGDMSKMLSMLMNQNQGFSMPQNMPNQTYNQENEPAQNPSKTEFTPSKNVNKALYEKFLK